VGSVWAPPLPDSGNQEREARGGNKTTPVRR
jgi:hypothetical protein